MGKVYHTSGHSKQDKDPPPWERLAVRAMVAAYLGKDYRRHIHRAQIAARRAEFEQAVEQSYRVRARRARV